MVQFENLPIDKLINPEGFVCECGKTHKVSLKYLKIGRNAIASLPECLSSTGITRPFVVCDQNTYAAAGERAVQILNSAGIKCTLFMLSEHGYPKCEPNEWSLGSLAMNFDTKCDGIIAVGGGVINDLCKVLAFDTNRPQIILGTAPSMDGFASNSSSMVVNEVKTTLYNRCPAGIVLDTEIMAKAPMRMLWAGFGDMIAKYISLCEWRISHLVIGEYYCEHVAQLMRNALNRIMAASDGLAKRDPDSVQAVAEGLVLSGIAMSFAEVSRPASGLEHYFSHMWEMLALERNAPADLHGIQVGVGTYLTMNLYDEIRLITPNREKALKHMAEFDPKEWENKIRRVFGKTAPQVLKIEEKTQKNSPEKHLKRLDAIIKCWDEIQKIIAEELPDKTWLFDKMRYLGMPMTPEDINISPEDVRDAFLCARDIRDKYLSCSLLWDIGEIEELAEKL